MIAHLANSNLASALNKLYVMSRICVGGLSNHGIF